MNFLIKIQTVLLGGSLGPLWDNTPRLFPNEGKLRDSYIVKSNNKLVINHTEDQALEL